MRISLGPGSAILLGIGLMVGTGNGDRILPAMNQATNALFNLKNLIPLKDNGNSSDVATGSDLLSNFNARIEKALSDMRDLVRADKAPPTILVHSDSSSDWTVTGIKCLLVFGATVGVCHILGINVWDVMGVTKKSLEVTVQGLSQTITVLQKGYEEGMAAVTDFVNKFRGDIHRVKEETSAKLDDLGHNVTEVKRKMADVGDSVGRMSELSHKANSSLRLMCQVLAENMPKSSLQRSLSDYAHGPRHIEGPSAVPEAH